MDNRVKNASNSFIWMILFLALSSLVPFILRSAIIHCLGMEYAGINSLFASLMRVFNLTDLGIGEAIVFYLYKPMAEQDTETANKLLNLYSKLYRIIGFIVLTVSVLLFPFLPHLINGSCPSDVNLYAIYIIYVADSLISYFYKAYCMSIFKTTQSLYYVYRVKVFVWIFIYLMQFVGIIALHNYYIYAIANPLVTFLTATIDYYIAKKKYPEYKPYGKIEKSFYPDFFVKVTSMAVMKVRTVLRETLDSLVISMVLGLVALAQYNNYTLVLSVPLMLMDFFKQAILQSLGNSVAVETKESNRAVVKLYSFIVQWLAVVFSAELLCLLHNFMILWVGNKNVFPLQVEIIFVIYYYARQLTNISEIIRNSTGIWRQGRWVSGVETIVNLTLNIVLVRCWGVSGVIIATIVSLVVINIPLENYYVFKCYFEEKVWKILVEYLINAVIAGIIVYVSYICVSKLPGSGIGSFLLKAIAGFVIPNVFLFFIHIKDSRLWDIIALVKSVFK